MSSRPGSPSRSAGPVKGRGYLPWTQRHADIVTYGVLLHAYENRHKIYAMEGLLGEVDNHGCDRLGKQVISCLKDMAAARGMDPTIVDDIKKGRAKGEENSESGARSGNDSGSNKKRSRGLGLAVVSDSRGSKQRRKVSSLPSSASKGKGTKRNNGADRASEGKIKKGKMREVDVIELLDSDDDGARMTMMEELE